MRKYQIAFFIVVFLFLCTYALPLQAASKKNSSKAAVSTEERSLVRSNKNQTNGRRIALVIGNGAYRHTDSMPKLSNPTNDAEDMAAALRKFGFDVISRKNLIKEDMDEAITEFGRKIADSDAALFYYAGHGLQVKGQNYLVPVDANIDSEAKVPYRAINVNQLLEEMDTAKSRVNIVMLDACRNNPISGKFRSGNSLGLAPPAAMPKGTVIVYATDPGNVAADGSGRNGLFTSGLLNAFNGNDLSLGGVLYAASKQVQYASNQEQTPYINGPATVQREFYFVQPSSMTDLKKPEYLPAPVTPVQVAQPKPTALSEDDSLIYTDPQSGLQWVRNGNIAGTEMTWNDAIKWVKNLDYAGYNDWRLPTKDELESLAKQGGNTPADWFNANGFNNVQARYYWSSTAATYGTLHVSMLSGYVSSHSYTANIYAWPVRGGK